MADSDQAGKRLIVSLIDEYATNNPSRVWASIPKDNDDLTKGFKDISFQQFANAINHAAKWLEQTITSQFSHFETLAYIGPKDLRYPILAVAAVKCGIQLLLPSRFATLEGQLHLLSATSCRTYLHAADLGPFVHSVLQAQPSIRSVEVPELEEWLWQEKTCVFPYTKTWEEAKSDPWLIFHTSGTTGLPKPIVFTNQMMTSLDAAKTMPATDQETPIDHFSNGRWYTPLPNLHFVGMTVTLQWPIFLNSILVVGPPTSSATSIAQVLEQGNANGALMPPSLISDLCRTPEGLQQLRKLDYLYFAGAPLPKSIADQLRGHVKLHPAMGTTEAGPYFTHITNTDDWEYYSFHPAMGVEFEHVSGELYEFVFHRRPELERWQQIFQVYPALDRFPTKDLWTRHPSQPDRWRYAGRSDDFVKLSHGEGIYAAEIEAEIQEHPEVKAALIGGVGRACPFLIIDLVSEGVLEGADREAKLERIWPLVRQVNERCAREVKVASDRIIFTEAGRPFVRTAKGTVSRHASITLYASEIETLYEK
ncbi:hypothetical protein MMC30_007814 [Trapelia coarctata]|nr:hypothetical protein [Trapelia coarctata]